MGPKLVEIEPANRSYGLIAAADIQSPEELNLEGSKGLSIVIAVFKIRIFYIFQNTQ